MTGKIRGDDKYRFYLNSDKIREPLELVYIQLLQVNAKKITDTYDYSITSDKAKEILDFNFS